MSKRNLLIEAIRRLDLFHADKDPLDAWSGLGNRSTYKAVLDAGLMTWVNIPAPRCMGWLRLTKAGLAEVEKIRNQHGEPMIFCAYNLIPRQRSAA